MAKGLVEWRAVDCCCWAGGGLIGFVRIGVLVLRVGVAVIWVGVVVIHACYAGDPVTVMTLVTTVHSPGDDSSLPQIISTWISASSQQVSRPSRAVVTPLRSPHSKSPCLVRYLSAALLRRPPPERVRGSSRQRPLARYRVRLLRVFGRCVSTLESRHLTP